MEVLSREFAALYRAFIEVKPSPLPDLPIQYADFAVWQRQHLSGDLLDKQLAYWRNQLADLPLLQLPTDHPRPAVASFRGAYQKLSIPPALTAALRELSQQQEVTLFMTLLAAFQVLLSRYSGQDDIVVGSPIANRNRTEIENLIGFFVNTLVMRTDMSGDPTFTELLVRVKEMALQAYGHQDLPFEKLVEELHPERDLSRNPLVQVIFQLFSTARATKSAPSVSLFEVKRQTAIFDMAITLTEADGGLTGGIEYSTDLFDNASINRLALHFLALLQDIAANPHKPLSQLTLLTAAELRLLLLDWNSTSAPYAADRSIHELFDQQAERSPEAVAVVFANERVSYQQLSQRSNHLAARLQKMGVGPEVLVGICMERSIEMVVGLLAVLKAGGAYVPLDPAYPKERLAFMVEDAGVEIVLTQGRLEVGLPAGVRQVIKVDEQKEARGKPGKGKVSWPVNPENLAYVIYTSGSTGSPKGVMISHAALCNHMNWMQERFPLGMGDKVLQKTPVSFDASVWEFYAPLLTGACLVVATPEPHMDGVFLAHQVREGQITTIQLVPSLLKLCLDDPEFCKQHSLKYIFCGGEALPADLIKQFKESGLKAELYNLYGPSEATIDSTYWQSDAVSDLRNVPIGKPISNTQAYVLDARLQPVPAGVPGELFIGGAGLARGYLNRPELTAERFLPHPFADLPGRRLYRTGDLARFRPDGALEFLGRQDNQVKLRGYRIELGEVETVLRQHRQVREAVVMVREDQAGDQRLVAYVVGDKQRASLTRDLRAFLKSKLPEYMLPSDYVELEQMPLTPNGKLNRLGLPQPGQAPVETALEYVAPRDAAERKLAEIWTTVLHKKPISIHDNFFNLGGHSLLATQITSRVRKEFQVEISVRTIFETGSIAELAVEIHKLKTTSDELEVPAIVPIARSQHRIN